MDGWEPIEMHSEYVARQPRSLEQYHAQLLAAFGQMALTDARRGALAVRIREVEAEIDSRAARRAASQ